MNYLEKLLQHYQSLTEEDRNNIAYDFVSAFQDKSNKIERHLEFLHYKENSIRASSTLGKIIASLNLSEIFTPGEINILEYIDLFGILHLEPAIYTPQHIEDQLRKRNLCNKIYSEWSSEFNQPETYKEVLLNKKNKLQDISKGKKIIDSSLGNTILNLTDQNPNILSQILSEIEVIYKIIDSNFTYQQLINHLSESESLVRKIFFDQNLYELYLDLWLSSRALEADENEFYGVIDKISSTGLIFTSNNELIEKEIQKIANDPRFVINATNNSVTLIQSASKGIQDSIQNISNIFGNENAKLKALIRILNLLDSSELQTLVEINEIVNTQQSTISSIDLSDLISLIKTENKNSQEKYIEINLKIIDLLNKIANQSEQNSTLSQLKSNLKKIQATINKLYLEDIDIFKNSDQKRSLLNIINEFKGNFDLLIEATTENLDNIFINVFENKATNTNSIIKSIITRIENRFSTKYQTLIYLKNLSPHELLSLKGARNQKLLDVIKRNKLLIDEPNDHQGIISALVLNLNNLLGSVKEDDIYTLIDYSSENLTNLENKMEEVVKDILDKYHAFTQHISEKIGKKNFNLSDIGNLDKDILEKYQTFKEVISLIQFCGFCLSAEEITRFSFEFKKDILESYLKGWRYYGL